MGITHAIGRTLRSRTLTLATATLTLALALSPVGHATAAEPQATPPPAGAGKAAAGVLTAMSSMPPEALLAALGTGTLRDDGSILVETQGARIVLRQEPLDSPTPGRSGSAGPDADVTPSGASDSAGTSTST